MDMYEKKSGECLICAEDEDDNNKGMAGGASGATDVDNLRQRNVAT